jgi:hypothetical protein
LFPLLVYKKILYGSWNGRTYPPSDNRHNPKKDKPFDGNVRDNVATLRNLILFGNNAYKSFERTAFWYGLGDTENPANATKNRQEYANDVIRRYNKLKPFFDCLHK